MTDETEIPAYPEGIGPHEGRELELMLAGKKPLAMFYEAVVLPVSDFYPEEDFMVHVESGALIRRDEIYQPRSGDIAGHYVYYALPSEVWRIDAIHELQLNFFSGRKNWTEDDEWTIGRLLGYSDQEISTFIEWTRNNRRAPSDS